MTLRPDDWGARDLAFLSSISEFESEGGSSSETLLLGVVWDVDNVDIEFSVFDFFKNASKSEGRVKCELCSMEMRTCCGLFFSKIDPILDVMVVHIVSESFGPLDITK